MPNKKFPLSITGKDKRCFHEYWYEQRWWLTYSQLNDTRVRLKLVMIGPLIFKTRLYSAKYEFCLYGSNNWINGLKTLSNHEKSKCHIDSCVAYGEFKKTNISEKISENYSCLNKLKVFFNGSKRHAILDNARRLQNF
ncbi:hypothetical protein BpHYR1_047344 [Brachionus plicatilis]|uniref:Uncharacterized protein n=1 Tax=Brachionus plicatilis TaxID=10195 RepID=A0A3M7PGH1_BRAPC|nr:hypothetical protein BpHYR1_047344 [Brachionus plicatilis]